MDDRDVKKKKIKQTKAPTMMLREDQNTLKIPREINQILVTGINNSTT